MEDTAPFWQDLLDRLLQSSIMDSEVLLTLLAIVVLLFLSAFFSGSETSLTAASQPRMHTLERQGNARAALVNRLLADKERLIGSILLGNREQEIVLVTGGGATLAEDTHAHDDVLPIGELLGGLQWMTRPGKRSIWYVRGGYRAETWFGTGGPVEADSNLGLHGMLLSIGAQW